MRSHRRLNDTKRISVNPGTSMVTDGDRSDTCRRPDDDPSTTEPCDRSNK
ncbi:hypothetical protein [Pelovirga terrestris]|uniref:Uncharacterized protein n=1 Tax=Pelovirga terrestris TaxID=2771352 RepID=A0A8J6QXU7_9BACT|nr:hypothetical protein [Pelovirga terrestris]MBD1401106.1 hypothetical protein [Pelovirga terrestris]